MRSGRYSISSFYNVGLVGKSVPFKLFKKCGVALWVNFHSRVRCKIVLIVTGDRYLVREDVKCDNSSCITLSTAG